MDTETAKSVVYSYRWVMFAVLTAAYFFVYFHRMSVNAVGGDMIADIGSGSKEFLSSIYFWTYAFMQIPSGILADRYGPRKATTVFLALATLGSMITCFADSFLLLSVGKVLIAAGMAVVYIPLMKIISVWYGKEDFPQLNGIVIAVGNVGALAAAGPLYSLSEAIGWRNVFLVLALITMLLTVLCYALIRDHPSKIGAMGIEDIRKAETGVSDDDRTDGSAPVLAGLSTVLGSGRIFWTMAIGYFLIYGTIMVFQGTTSIQYFRSDVYSFAMAAWFVTMIAVGKIASTLLIGRLTTMGVIHSKKSVMMFGTFLYAIVWGIIWLFAGDIDNPWFWMIICTLFGLFGGFMTLSFSQVKEWFPISISGTAMSMMNVCLFLGSAVMTALAGVVLHTVYSLENYTTLWGIMFAMAALAFVLVCVSRERKEGDAMLMPEETDG